MILIITIITFVLAKNFSGEGVFNINSVPIFTSHKLLKQVAPANLDEIYSAKKLGSFIESEKTYFRLFAPTALKVILCTFTKPNDIHGSEYEMHVDNNGVWETVINKELDGIYYGYKVYHQNDNLSNKKKVISTDPYAKAVASFSSYMNPRRAIVYRDNYNWENDNWIQRDWRDLIIYEMHVRDMTAHPTSGVKHAGTYKGLIEPDRRGGINYIKSLGVNTVELLPTMEFANCEIPFKDSLDGKFNTWNPYERNHWGYMTSNYFAPSSYYAMNWKQFEWNKWMGTDGQQVTQFKDMVKAFHKEGIGVIMDVVYNHLSEYEIGNLKEIDKQYYFRLDENNNYIAQSYCGNDIKSERPMMRRLILDSIIYWMKEYHVDGFRFDLGKLLDWHTLEEIIKEAKKINPKVVFVAEPWGGGYDPKGFSERGWGAWNDQIRNGIKGENPNNGLGWIFGKWYGNNSPQRIQSYVNGTLLKDSLGLFEKKEHSVNYLESHDGYTLGDFIRLGTGEVDRKKIITDLNKNAVLTPLQMKLNKLAALFLFTSQGITMISEGQEFARSKVIPFDIKVQDKEKGLIDHNSYNKDNSTNYLNYNYADLNKELVDYYKGLIKLRNNFSAFRRAKYDSIKFTNIPKNKFALSYTVKNNGETFVVLFNANQKNKQTFVLPEGNWNILANNKTAGINSIGKVNNQITLPAISGFVLRKID